MALSGRGKYYRRKRVVTIEQTKQIDIRYMKRQGLLEPGASGTLFWSIGESSLGGVNYLVTASQLMIWFESSGSEQAAKQVRQDICFDFTLCNYGGYRTWLRCPGCFRRVVQLCGYGDLFLCRHCHRLPYRSCNDTKVGRLLLQKHKLGQAIFQSYDQGRGRGKKRGLHWDTFYRLKADFDQLELACL